MAPPANKGRRKGGTFAAIPHHILESTEYAKLSPRAVKLLVDLLAQYRGANNGDLTTAWTVTKPRGWKSRDQLSKATAELEKGGWILRTRQGGIHKSNLFAVTWLPVHECGGKLDVRASKTPPNLWRSAPATVIPISKRSAPKPRSDQQNGSEFLCKSHQV